MSSLSSKFRFKPHIIDTDLPGRFYAQTALADLDGDGKLEFVLGQSQGPIYAYKCHAPDQSTTAQRRATRVKSVSNVHAAPRSQRRCQQRFRKFITGGRGSGSCVDERRRGSASQDLLLARLANDLSQRRRRCGARRPALYLEE